MKIIAFGHRKRVGKDLACSILFRHLRVNKINVQKAGFAQELKRVCHSLYGWAGLMEPEFYEQPSNESKREEILSGIYKTPRQIWIEVSQKLKDVHNDTWLNLLFNKYSKCEILLISDLRFPNEVEAIRKRGGTLVKIINPRIEPTSDIADDALEGFSDWDYIINNDGSIEQYNTNLMSLIQDVQREIHS